jgi:hypothetical protein
MIGHFLIAAFAFACANATPLDDYVWKEDSNYGWVDMVFFPAHDINFTYLLTTFSIYYIYFRVLSI